MSSRAIHPTDALVADRLSLHDARDPLHPEAGFVRRDKVIFLHIPKSGGTSFDTFLSGFFPMKDVLPANLQSIIAADWKDEYWEQYRYFKIGYWFDRVKAQKPRSHMLTLLRDPVKRVISYYWHLRRDKDFTDRFDGVVERRNADKALAAANSLADWARVPATEPGAYPRNACTGAMTIGWYALRKARPETWPVLLERAKQVLREELAFVGIVEEYERTKEVFCRTFGIPMHYTRGEERCNTSPFAAAREKPDEATLAVLREENWLDVELYKYARQLLAERREVLRRLPPDDLGTVESHAGAAPPRGEIVISGMMLRGSGMYPPESLPDGRTLRWTGAYTMATVDVVAHWPSQGALRLELDLAGAVKSGILAGLQVRIDGVAARRVMFQSASNASRMICEFELSPAMAVRRLHQVEICSALDQLPGSGPAADTRLLGVAMQRLCCRWAPEQSGCTTRGAA